MCKDRLTGLNVGPVPEPASPPAHPRTSGTGQRCASIPNAHRLCGEKSGGAFQPGDPVYQPPLALVLETSSRAEWTGVYPFASPANGGWMSASRAGAVLITMIIIATLLSTSEIPSNNIRLFLKKKKKKKNLAEGPLGFQAPHRVPGEGEPITNGTF